MTAELFSEVSEQAASTIKYSSYVDDLVDSLPSPQVATQVTKDVETILSRGGFLLKEWQYGGIGVHSKEQVRFYRYWV